MRTLVWFRGKDLRTADHEPLRRAARTAKSFRSSRSTRIFNPVTQGQKFDPEAAYVRRWVPELARLDARHVHAPWLAPAATLAAAGIRLGDDHPRPIVHHDTARHRFLEVAKQHLGRTQIRTDSVTKVG